MPNIADSLLASAGAQLGRLTSLLPQLIEAVALLVIGWLLARLAQAAARRAAGLIDTLLMSMTRQSRLSLSRFAPLIGTVAFWVVLLFFVTEATHSLGLRMFTEWLARLLNHLPTVAAGLLIIAVGYVLAGLAAKLVEATSTGLQAPQRAALARAAQVATMLVAVLVGADQIGLKVVWIAILLAVLLASVMGGVTIAASLGARGYVANLIGAHYLRQAFEPGETVRVAGVEGRIVETTATSLVLDTREGRVLIPGRVYHDETILLIARSESD